MYVFTHEPHMFRSTLTPRVFELEFIIHKLIIENVHFIIFKKDFEIKFPWVVGPFIIKKIKMHFL